MDDKEIEYHAGVAKELGLFAIKTLITLNSGAAAIMLSFVGPLLNSNQSSVVIEIPMLKLAMVSFLVGIAFGLISAGSTYVLSQLTLTESRLATNMRLQGFLLFIMVPPILSFAAFASGMLVALSAAHN